MAATIFLRIVQLISLAGVIVAGFQLGPLSSEIRSVLAGEAVPLARLAGRIAAVTGPLAVSVVIAALLELSIRSNSQEAKLRAAHPTEPWLWKPQWAASHIRLSNKPLVIGWLCFFALYLAIAVPLAIASDKKPFMIFAGVVGLIALLVLRMIWISRNWNRAELRIATLPGVIGGPFSGAVILHEKFPADTIFDVNLSCKLTETVRYQKKSETRHTDLWSSTLHIQQPLGGGPKGTTALPVSFAIPFEAQPTSTKNDQTVRWTLSVQKKEEVSTGGASFEIPVYRTADSQKNFKLDDSLIRKHLAVIGPDAALRRFAMREERLSADHLRLHFREFDLSIFLTLLVMSAILVPILVCMWFWIKNGNTRLFSMVFPGVFLAMIVYGIIHMLFWRCRIELFTTVDANQPETLAELAIPEKKVSTIQAESGILGLRKSLRVAGGRDTSLRCKIDHRANNQESWSIWLCGPDQKSLKLLGTFPSSSEAHVAARFLAEKLGISAAGVKAEDGFISK